MKFDQKCIQFAVFDDMGPIVATTRAAEAIGPFTPDEVPQTICSVRNLRRDCLGMIGIYTINVFH